MPRTLFSFSLIIERIVDRILAIPCVISWFGWSVVVLQMGGTAASAQELQPRILDRSYLQGVPFPNTLHPSTMTIDPRRGLLCVYSAAYEHIAVLDIPARSQNGIIPVGPLSGRNHRLHCVEPVTRTICMSVRHETGGVESTELIAISVFSNRIVARRELGFCPYISIISHPTKPQIIVSTGGEHLLFLDPGTLATLDSINTGMHTGGIVADSVDQTICIAESDLQSDSIHVKLFSLKNRQALRTFSYQSSEALPELMVDPELKSFVVFGSGLIRYFDNTGLPVHQFRVSGSIKRHTFYPLTHQLIVLDSAGNAEQGKKGRFGKLFRYSLQGIDVDSFVVGPDAVDCVFNPRTGETAVLASGSATVEIYHAASMRLQQAIRLGHSVEDLITSVDGGFLTLANTYGSGNCITRVDLIHDRVERDIVIGSGPVRCIRMSDGTIVVLNHFESTLAFLDKETGRVDKKVTIPGIKEGRSDVLPSISISKSDVLLASFPEQEIFVLVDLKTGQRIRVDGIDGYRFSAGNDSTGAVQPAWVQGSDNFVLYLPRQGRLNVYSSTTTEMLFDIDVSQFERSALQPFRSLALRTGIKDNEVFIGPYLVDLTSRSIRQVLEGASVFAGIGLKDRGWAIESDGSNYRLMEYGINDWLPVRRYDLDSVPFDFLVTAIHFAREQQALFLGDGVHGRVLVVHLLGMTAMTKIPDDRAATISILPNPPTIRRDRGITLLSSEDMAGASVFIQDISGATVWKSGALVFRKGCNFIPTGRFAPSPGWYQMTVLQAASRKVLTFISIR